MPQAYPACARHSQRRRLCAYVYSRTTFRHRAEFCPPSDRLVGVHMHSTQTVLNALGRALPHEVLLSFRSLGFGADLADICATCEAGILHQALTSTAVHAAWAQYDTELARHDIALAAIGGGAFALPRHRRRSCTRISYAGHLHPALWLRSHSDPARLLCTASRPTQASPRALRALRHRACNWDAVVLEALIGAYLHFSSIRPTCELQFFALPILCNAWCTTARFGNASSACLFRRGIGGDSQAHLPLYPV